MRHIDADKVMEEVNRMGGHNLCDWSTLGVKALINRQPTADVVPRAEVENLQAQIAQYQLDLHYSVCREDEAAARTAREIFEEIEKIDEDTVSFQEFYSQIMKFKKEYTEGVEHG